MLSPTSFLNHHLISTPFLNPRGDIATTLGSFAPGSTTTQQPDNNNNIYNNVRAVCATTVVSEGARVEGMVRDTTVVFNFKLTFIQS